MERTGWRHGVQTRTAGLSHRVLNCGENGKDLRKTWRNVILVLDCILFLGKQAVESVIVGTENLKA